jgi:integrase
MEIEPSLDGWVERLDPDLPLLRGLDLNRSALETLSASAIYKSLKGFFSDVANRAALLSDKERKRFAEASTHWLRHTFATHAVADNAPLDVIRDVMGHASISTTSIYVSAEKKRRVAQMEKLAELRRQRLDHHAPETH